jgi:DNA-binding CsgD family transcriptional regulator
MWECGLQADLAADRLGITVQTVYAHTKNARSRLGVVTTAEAIRIARAYLTLGVAGGAA